MLSVKDRIKGFQVPGKIYVVSGTDTKYPTPAGNQTLRACHARDALHGWRPNLGGDSDDQTDGLPVSTRPPLGRFGEQCAYEDISSKTDEKTVTKHKYTYKKRVKR